MGSFKDFGKKILAGVGSDIKRLVNDNVTGNVECACCKKPVNVLVAKKTQDGKPICKECFEELPFDMQYMIAETEYERVREILEYRHYSKQVLEPKFSPDMRYGSFAADSVNGLVKVGRDILEMKNLQFHVLVFEPKESKSGILGTKVLGDVKAMFSLKDSGLWFDQLVDFDVSAKAKSNFLGDKVTYEEPPQLVAFVQQLDAVIAKFQAEA